MTSAPQLLIVIQNIPFRLDRRVRSEAAALRAAGWGVSVICPRDPGEPARFVLDGVHVHTYPPAPVTSGLLSFVLEFTYAWIRTAQLSVQVRRQRGFDVLHACNPPDTYWLLGLLWRPFGVRFVFDQHDLCPEVYEAKFARRGPLRWALLALERASYVVADLVISTNSSYREVALARGRVSPNDVAVVMSSPDPAAMRRGVPVPELRRGAEHLIVYVGIMGPQDGVDRLLQATHHLVHVLNRADVRVALLGYGDSLETLRAVAAELSLLDHVTFTGRVDHDQITRWLSTADVGVTPDPHNEFNDRSTMNKTLEYMAHELPIVATDLAETRSSAGDAAIYVDSPVQMAEALAALLDDPQRRRAMGLAGRCRIEGALAWPHQARTLVRSYDRFVGRSDRTGSLVTPEQDVGYRARSPGRTMDSQGERGVTRGSAPDRAGGFL